MMTMMKKEDQEDIMRSPILEETVEKEATGETTGEMIEEMIEEIILVLKEEVAKEEVVREEINLTLKGEEIGQMREHLIEDQILEEVTLNPRISNINSSATNWVSNNSINNISKDKAQETNSINDIFQNNHLHLENKLQTPSLNLRKKIVTMI